MGTGREEKKALPPLRAPLFPASLAFGLGCWAAGFFAPPLWPPALVTGTALGVWLLTRHARISLAAFYLACFGAAALHARLPDLFPAPDDLRSLPAEKSANPAWEGRVAGIPSFLDARAARAVHPATPQALPADARGTARFPLAVERWRPANGEAWAPARGTVEATVVGTSDRWQYGQRVRLAGPLALPSPPEAPGRFDARAYLSGRGVFYTLRAADGDAAVVAPGSDLVAAFVRAAGATRRWGIERLHAGLETDPLVGQLLTGIVLGQRDEVPPAALFPFRHTGTYHLFSTNGGDLALLLAIVLGALKLCGVIRWRWGWLLAPLLLFYALVSGSQPSVIRGFAAALMILGAWAAGRPVQPLNLWGLTVLVVLALWPRAALDLGFQFSFLIVLALLLLATPFAAWLKRPFALDPFVVPRHAPPWRRWQGGANAAAAAVLGSCAAAWTASVVLETAYFHQLCLVGIPANALGVPLAGLIFTVGLCSLAGGAVWGPLSVLFNNANWVFAKALLLWVGLLAQLPDASVYLPLGAGSDREPQFTVAPAGYGTSTLLRYRGKAWLLNPSDERGFFHDVDATRKYLGVNRLSGVVLDTWAAAEAAASPLLPAVLPTGPFSAPPWGTARRPAPWAQGTLDRLRPAVWTAGTREELAPGLAVTVLSPGDEPARLAEDRGLVLLFEYGSSRLLYAGTVGFGIEARVLAANGDGNLRADVLVEGRHSAESNLSEPWLRQVAPDDIVLIDRRSPSRLHGDFLFPLETKPRVWDQAETGALKVTLHAGGGATVAPWAAGAAAEEEAER